MDQLKKLSTQLGVGTSGGGSQTMQQIFDANVKPKPPKPAPPKGRGKRKPPVAEEQKISADRSKLKN